MAAGKKTGAPAPRPRSGFATEEMRGTVRLTLRLDPDTMSIIEAHAFELGWTKARVIAEAVRAFDREVAREDGGNPHPSTAVPVPDYIDEEEPEPPLTSGDPR